MPWVAFPCGIRCRWFFCLFVCLSARILCYNVSALLHGINAMHTRLTHAMGSLPMTVYDNVGRFIWLNQVENRPPEKGNPANTIPLAHAPPRGARPHMT